MDPLEVQSSLLVDDDEENDEEETESVSGRYSLAKGSFYFCWCGEPIGHSWPGKAHGAPHPR